MVHIGTQTFGLAKELTSDFTGTLHALRKIGFDAVEPLALFNDKQGKTPKNLWAQDILSEALPVMNELGMVIPSIHIGVGYGWLSMPVKIIAKNILSLQERIGAHDYVISGLFATPAQTKHWATLMRKVSDAVHPSGARILCHTHDDEFRRISYRSQSREAIDVFFDLVGPDVMLQLDIGWAAMAGDEVSIAGQYADRIASLHLKDFYPGFREGGFNRTTVPESQFAPIGGGAVKHEQIIAMRDQFPNFNGSLIVDQDKYAGDMLESLKVGYENVCAWVGECK